MAAAKDGHQPRCKECSREVLREWQEANRKRTAELGRQYYAQNGTARRAYRRRYYQQNRDAVLAWFRERPERDIAKQHARRARIGKLGAADTEYIAILRGDPCSYCGVATAGTTDHIEPLSSGGSSGWENLTASCRSCNSSKRTATLLAFLARA